MTAEQRLAFTDFRELVIPLRLRVGGRHQGSTAVLIQSGPAQEPRRGPEARHFRAPECAVRVPTGSR